MPPLLLFALLFVPQDKAPERCVVSGTVVDSVTERPVAKVEIELRPTERATNHIAFTRTDADGRFTMIDVDAGSYRLVGTRAGYLESFYGARRAQGAGAVLRLDAGQKLDSLQMKIVPAAVISGRVVDADGDPVGQAHVVLAERYASDGRFRVQGADSTGADDQGFFRFGELAPGKYWLIAEPKSAGWDKVDHSPSSDAPREALLPTLFSGATDLASATPFELRPGDRREGIEMRLLRSRVFRVSGRVVNGGQTRPVVTLRAITIDLFHDTNPRTTTKNAAGDFEFRDVAPGSYWLQIGQSFTRVDVGYADLGDLRVSTGQAADVNVRVTVEGPEKPPSLVMSVFLTGPGRDGIMFDTDATGRATHRLDAGSFAVDLFRGPKGYYVRSIRSGDRDVLADRLETPPSGAVPLDIVLAADGGTVEGTVAEATGGVTVLLMPANRARADFYKTATTDQYGHFSATGVPPGTYKAFAWDDVKEGDWFDPEFLKLYETQGVEFKLDPRGTKSLDLKIARDK